MSGLAVATATRGRRQDQPRRPAAQGRLRVARALRY